MLGTQEGVGIAGHLEGVHEVFYQEEMPQLGSCRDHLRGNLLGQTFCLFPSQGQVHVQVGPERTKRCEGLSGWMGPRLRVMAGMRAMNGAWGEGQG